MRKHPNNHRWAKATAPVLDSTRHYTHNTLVLAGTAIPQFSLFRINT
jgi:uncharacterized membrane protein